MSHVIIIFKGAAAFVLLLSLFLFVFGDPENKVHEMNAMVWCACIGLGILYALGSLL